MTASASPLPSRSSIISIAPLVLSLIFGTCQGADPPNILLITADDMHWNSLGAFGCPVEGTTPNLDALAGQGQIFRNAYVPIALCTPSRHVMLSGNHSHQTATRCFTPIQRVGPTLPDLLAAHGYLLANINKRQNDYSWDITIDEADSAMGRDVPFFAAAASRVFSAAADAGKPFFLMANTNDPHRPFSGSEAEAASPKYAALLEQGRITVPSRRYSPAEISVPGFLPDLSPVRMEMAQYYSSVRRADDIVGQILEELDIAELTENTLVVFLSDHGISMPYSKMNCYKASLRTPLIVRWPGQVEASSSDDRLVSSVDLAPTLLEAVGIEVPPQMAGRSFAPTLHGAPCAERDAVVGYYYRNLRQEVVYPTFAVHTKRFAYIYNPWVDGVKEVHNSDYTNSPTLNAMWEAAETDPNLNERVAFHKYRVVEEFYDYENDPFALDNCIDKEVYSSQIAHLREVLALWMAKTAHPAQQLVRNKSNLKLRNAYIRYEEATARLRLAEIHARQEIRRVAIERERKQREQEPSASARR